MACSQHVDTLKICLPATAPRLANSDPWCDQHMLSTLALLSLQSLDMLSCNDDLDKADASGTSSLNPCHTSSPVLPHTALACQGYGAEAGVPGKDDLHPWYAHAQESRRIISKADLQW